ncbi:MAG: hypothetical protein K2H02_00335 [Anaeroplasmataceae bacterium]|nr:hypothetical protein [Anaeroplasmataceae bacterium]
MDIYTDYANWKFENSSLIEELVRNKSKTISRFTSVIAVVDYLYEQYLKKEYLNEDETLFFSMGFDYIHDNFYTIKTILEYKFDKDFKAMETCAKTINLLLYVNEFQAELLNQKNEINLQPLDDFEIQVNSYLDRKENVPDVFFPMLDDIVNPIYEQNNIEMVPIESIYYEIAVEYGIYKDNEIDIYNAVFHLEKKKK